MVSGISMSRSGWSIALDHWQNPPIQLLYTYCDGGKCQVAENKPCNPCQCPKHHSGKVLLQHDIPERIELYDGTHLRNNPRDTWARKYSIECITLSATNLQKDWTLYGTVKYQAVNDGNWGIETLWCIYWRPSCLVNIRRSEKQPGPGQTKPLFSYSYAFHH